MTALTLSTPVAKRAHFIPIRHAELVDLLCGEASLSARDRDGLRRFTELLAATLHFEFHQELDALKADYAPFDPDANTVPIASPGQSPERLDTLFGRFEWLLERANFSRLTQPEIEQALAAQSHWGLNLEVDFGVFERLAIFVRGEGVSRGRKRFAASMFRAREVETSTYERLVLILKLRKNNRTTGTVDTDDVYIKLFKDIPQMDLEMLLPGTRVKMSLLDRTKIVLPTLSGITLTAWKIVSGAVAVAAAGVYNGLTLCGLIGGSIGYGVRSFHGYLQTKQRYQLSLTESLYYRNLDNNAGVLMRLVDEAEEQENREALLAYYFLWQQAPAAGLTIEELDARVEAFLASKLGRPVDFEVDDALSKLVHFGLVENTSDGRLRAVSLEKALGTLDASWDHYFQYPQAA